MRNRRKWILAALCVITAAAMITTATVLMAGCNKSNAASAARTANVTTKRADSVMKHIDTVDNKSFRFPRAFGDEFFVCTEGDCVTVSGHETARDKSTHGDEIRKPNREQRRIGEYRRSRYKQKHFDMGRLNQNNEQRIAYLNRLDDLYLLCADISAANALV